MPSSTLANGHPQKPTTILVLETMTLGAVQARTASLKKHLKTLGYRESENLKTIVLNAEGKQGRGEDLIRSALAAEPDVVVTNATLASRAAKQVLGNSEIPQVFMLVGDPVGAGLVPAVGKPSGANITGNTHLLPANLKVDLLANMVGPRTPEKPLRIALLYSSYPSAISDFEEISDVGKAQPGLQFTGISIDYAPSRGATFKDSVVAMAEEAVTKLKAGAGQYDVYWVCNGPNAISRTFLDILRSQIDKPMIYANNPTGVELGGLFTLFSNADTNGRDTARMVHAILNGASAADIPVSRPNKFEVAVNVTTATNLGIVIPADMLELAGDSIFR